MSLFNEADKQKLKAAVRAAEENTAGELVVVLARRSDDYAAIRGTWALILAAALTPELHLLVPWLETHWLFWLLVLCVFPLYFLLGMGPLLRLVVPLHVREARAMERALRAFAEEGVTETRDRSGVLIFLSDLEHRVVILADKGIHERVDAGEWDRDVATLVSGLKSGQAVQSLLDVIERVGGLLSEKFPARAQNENELPDGLRER